MGHDWREFLSAYHEPRPALVRMLTGTRTGSAIQPHVRWDKSNFSLNHLLGRFQGIQSNLFDKLAELLIGGEHHDTATDDGAALFRYLKIGFFGHG